MAKKDFVEMYQRIFGRGNKTIVVSEGFVCKDTSHAFYNANDGMIGGPVFIRQKDNGRPQIVGVHLGLDRKANLHKFAAFGE